MELENMREIIAIEVAKREEWIDKLNDSSPGHYGVNDWNVTLSHNDVWVDIQSKKFSIKNAQFEFDLALGESKDPINDSFSKTATGSGSFEIKDGKLTIEELEVDVDLDLCGE